MCSPAATLSFPSRIATCPTPISWWVSSITFTSAAQIFPPVDLHAFGAYLAAQERTRPLATTLANWHVLHYLATQNARLPVDAQLADGELLTLFAAVTKDAAQVDQWASDTRAFSAIVALATQAVASAPVAAGGTAQWQCASCTFLNVATTVDCEMCGLPKNR